MRNWFNPSGKAHASICDQRKERSLHSRSQDRGTTVERVLSQFGPMSLHSNGGCFRDLFRGGLLSKPVPLQHLHAALLRRVLLPAQFDLVFMLVRDPVQRMISEYRHARELWRPEALMPFSV